MVDAMSVEAPHPTPIRRGTGAFHRTNLAMFAAGFAAFALLYCPQPLMPVFTEIFEITPATSSLVISFTTGALSILIMIAGLLSDRIGRKQIMTGSLFSSACLMIAAAFVGNFYQLLVIRLLMGISLSGIPAVAMAYLGEEIAADSIGSAMGLYIAGSAFGGMVGRVATAGLSDLVGWRFALCFMGGVGLICAALFWRNLPESRFFVATKTDFKRYRRGLQAHFGDAGLPFLFLMAFLLMGTFVTLYNYMGFRLQAAPFNLAPGESGILFTVYIVGMIGSAGAGSLADRFGRRTILPVMVGGLLLGIVATLSTSLIGIVIGMILVTFCFFGAHSVASSWVTRRAGKARGQASALYLFGYYLGSSLVGTIGGLVFHGFAWSGLVLLLVGLQVIAVAVALRLSRLSPLPIPRNPS